MSVDKHTSARDRLASRQNVAAQKSVAQVCADKAKLVAAFVFGALVAAYAGYNIYRESSQAQFDRYQPQEDAVDSIRLLGISHAEALSVLAKAEQVLPLLIQREDVAGVFALQADVLRINREAAAHYYALQYVIHQEDESLPAPVQQKDPLLQQQYDRTRIMLQSTRGRVPTDILQPWHGRFGKVLNRSVPLLNQMKAFLIKMAPPPQKQPQHLPKFHAQVDECLPEVDLAQAEQNGPCADSDNRRMLNLFSQSRDAYCLQTNPELHTLLNRT